MRINVYSQELTPEVRVVQKGEFKGISLMLHSSPMLHNRPGDDDRSAVTFWLPGSLERRDEIARAFEQMAKFFRSGGTQT